MAYASTRISGWIEDLHIDFTGIKVREGDELLSIYSPELVTAQEEYLTALKSIEELQTQNTRNFANQLNRQLPPQSPNLNCMD